MRLGALIAVCLLLATTATAEEFDQSLGTAQKALEAGDREAARSALDRAQQSAKTDHDRARVFFYLALAQDTSRDDGWSRAEDFNSRAIALDPRYGAALNNLAQLRARHGDASANREAMDLLRRAIAVGDKRRLLYMNNLAAIAVQARDTKTAEDLYGQLLTAQPDNIDAESRLIRITATDKAMSRLHAMLERGVYVPAQQIALDLIRDARFKGAPQRRLLAVVSESLARQRLSTAMFLASPAAKALGDLRDDANVGAGARGILSVYQGTPLGDEELNWWDQPNDETSRFGFGLLIRDIAARQAGAGKIVEAEENYRAALRLEHGADPDAFLGLADLYFAKGRRADLDKLVHDFEKPMFKAKADFIRREDLQGEYRFHVALGTMYRYLEQWGNESTPNSAIYQLKYAVDTANRFNSRPVKTKIPLDPRVIDHLADSYIGAKAPLKALAVRLNAAEKLKQMGKTDTAQRIVRPVLDQDLAMDPSLRLRLDKFQQIEKPANP